MKIHIDLDNEMIAEAMRLCYVTTEQEAVEIALHELIVRNQQRALRDLRDMDPIDPDYDVVEVRRNMNRTFD